MLRTMLFAICLVISAGMAVAAEPEPLFNGKDLSGWVQRGGKAKYTVEGDCIVGTAVTGTPNSFLCTEKDYGDFVLEIDFKIDDGLNSGIQIRSECFDEKTTAPLKIVDGKVVEKTYPAGMVHGYQVEVDAGSSRLFGAIYDEGRRGWLDNLAGEEHREAREAFKPGEWNHFRLACKGPSIKVWLNDVQAGTIEDDLTPRGFIALQTHGIGNNKAMAGKAVKWRNITIAVPQDATE